MKTAIVYYSLEGNTEFAAQKIAALLQGDLIRLQPKKAYPTGGFKKFFWGGKSAIMGEKPALEPYDFDASKYDLVVIGFPVWASTFAPPIRSFVKENVLPEKVAAFACQGGSGAEKAFGKLLSCIGRERLEAELVLIDPQNNPSQENDRKIEEFCNNLK